MTVLIVDDDVAVASLIQTALEKHEYDCLVAHSVIEAIHLYRVNMVDLIIADYHIGKDVNGSQLIALLKRENNVPAVLISASLFGENAEKTYDVFLSKPFRVEELIEIVEGIMVMA